MSLLEKQAGSSFDTASDDSHLQANVRRLRLLDAARAGATLLALLMGVVVLGLAGHTVQAYNASRVGAAHLPDDLAFLSVWPGTVAATVDGGDTFDFRPTVALLVGAALVVLANLVALTSHHRAVRARLLAGSAAHAPLTVTAPFVGLAAALIAVVFYYAVNRSDTADTLLSWSCRWTALPASGSSGAAAIPRFGTLCRASRAGLYLAILLIPVEALALTLAGWQLKMARYTAAYAAARRTPSPVLA